MPITTNFKTKKIRCGTAPIIPYAAAYLCKFDSNRLPLLYSIYCSMPVNTSSTICNAAVWLYLPPS